MMSIGSEALRERREMDRVSEATVAARHTQIGPPSRCFKLDTTDPPDHYCAMVWSSLVSVLLVALRLCKRGPSALQWVQVTFGRRAGRGNDIGSRCTVLSLYIVHLVCA